MPQTKRAGRGGNGFDDRLLIALGCTRGRDVDRLLEERTIQWVRLVEDRERRERAAVSTLPRRTRAPG
jgi:hypothetical protein